MASASSSTYATLSNLLRLLLRVAAQLVTPSHYDYVDQLHIILVLLAHCRGAPIVSGRGVKINVNLNFEPRPQRASVHSAFTRLGKGFAVWTKAPAWATSTSTPSLGLVRCTPYGYCLLIWTENGHGSDAQFFTSRYSIAPLSPLSYSDQKSDPHVWRLRLAFSLLIFGQRVLYSTATILR